MKRTIVTVVAVLLGCGAALEGRPQDVVRGEGRAKNAYEDFAAQLAERGFVTFAPQNLYIFKDRFRTLQRKANPLGKTLFSVIVPQHQQIVDWLQTLPYVDPDRIAFYGLPPVCTVKIFTERGDMIYEKYHDDGSGDEIWDSLTSSGQIVVSGIYILYVETPDGRSVFRKFVVIR